jgi:hypothetical protein
MIIAFTGTHGVGKTTSVYKKAHDLKIQLPDKKVGVFNENAAWCPFPINEGTTRDAQLWMFTNQISTEMEYLSRYDIVVSDRTCVDCIAYSIYRGFDDIAEKMIEFSRCHIHRYKEVYFKEIEKNPWALEDGFRSVEEHFRKNIELILKSLYEVLNMNITLV